MNNTGYLLNINGYSKGPFTYSEIATNFGRNDFRAKFRHEILNFFGGVFTYTENDLWKINDLEVLICLFSLYCLLFNSFVNIQYYFLINTSI